jgi:hypothetical protein
MKIEDLKIGQIWKPKDKPYYLYVKSFTNDTVIFMVAEWTRFTCKYTIPVSWLTSERDFKGAELVDDKKEFFRSVFSGMVMK